MLGYLQEETEGLAFLDILHKLEKLDLIESVIQWQTLREIRNEIAHQYDDSAELMSSALKAILNAKVDLESVYKKLQQNYQQRLGSANN